MTIIQISDLLLRPIAPGDANRFVELCNDESLARNTSRLPFPYTLEHATAFVRRSVDEFNSGAEYRFAVCNDEKIIACVGVMNAEDRVFDLGYWVGKSARGQGVATKAASAMVGFAFERLNAKTITAGFFIDNPSSGHILEKLGFAHTGKTSKVNSLARGCEVDTIQLVLSQSAFKPTHSITLNAP